MRDDIIIQIPLSDDAELPLAPEGVDIALRLYTGPPIPSPQSWMLWDYPKDLRSRRILEYSGV